ncbi:hypothetical protein Tco_1148435 [Tanacetum coccineum]
MIDQLKPLNNYGSLQTGGDQVPFRDFVPRAQYRPFRWAIPLLLHEFACPALFLWNSDLNVIKDPAPSADEFSQREYDLLLANPALFRKFPDEFLCWVIDPLKVKIGEREHKEGEAKILEATTGRIVSLLPIAPARPEGELEASVDRLFDGSGSGDHGESAEGGNIVSEQVETVIEDAPMKKVRRQKKRKAVVEDVSADYVIGANHPPKRVREDYATPSGPTTGDKSQAILDSLLADARLNVEIMVSPIPTMPFITSSVSVTPGHEDPEPPECCSIRLLLYQTPLITLVHILLTPKLIPMSGLRLPSPFLTGSHSTGGAIPSARGFTDLTGSDFMVGGFRTVVNQETVDELAPQCFFAVVRNMEHDQLFTEFNVGTARQVCLSVEVRTRAEFNIRERRRLFAKCEEQESLLVQTNEENASLKKQLLLKEAEAVEAIRLRGQAYAFEATEKSLQEEVKLLRERSLALENFVFCFTGAPDEQVKMMEKKLAKVDADLVAAMLHLEETFCPHLLTVVASRRWLLDHGMKLVVVKNLEDVAAYNPSTDADYDAAMQQFRDVSFSLLSELKSRKDASIEEVMDILRLEGSLAEFLGMGDLQPSVDQLMVPIYHPEDPVAVGSTSLSFSLDVLNQRVERIKGNLAAIRSALLGVFSPLRDPLSSIVLTGGEAVPENMPAVPENVSEPASTTTTLPTTLAMPSSTTPLSVLKKTRTWMPIEEDVELKRKRTPQKKKKRRKRRSCFFDYRSNGIEIQRCYLDYLEALVSHYKAARYIRIPLRIQALGASEITHGDGKRMDRWLQKRKEELKLQKERSRQKARKIHGLSKRDRACVVHSKISQTMKDSSKASATKNLKKEEQKILASRH